MELCADNKPSSRFETLPPEILKHICSYLACDIDSQHFLSKEKDLLHLSLVTRSITPWVQETLLDSPFIGTSYWKAIDDNISIALLACKLLERPSLGTKIRQLTVSLPRKHGVSATTYNAKRLTDRHIGSAFGRVDETIRLAEAFIKTLPIPSNLQKSWVKRLTTDYPYSLVGVILALSPNIRHLNITKDEFRTRNSCLDFLCPFFGVILSKSKHLAHVHAAGILGSLKSLHVYGAHAARLTGIECFSSVEKLHLQAEFDPDHSMSLDRVRVSESQFDNISHLHLEVELRHWNSALYRPIDHYGPFLAKFANIRCLDLSSTSRKPLYDRYPMEVDTLLEWIANPGKLVWLKLPHKMCDQNFPANAMVRFTHLETLMSPSSVIVNDGLDGFEALPSSLRYLHIQEATLDTVNCLLRLISEKLNGVGWHSIERVQMDFAKSFSSKSLDLLERNIMFPDMWSEAQKANVKILLGR